MSIFSGEIKDRYFSTLAHGWVSRYFIFLYMFLISSFVDLHFMLVNYVCFWWGSNRVWRIFFVWTSSLLEKSRNLRIRFRKNSEKCFKCRPMNSVYTESFSSCLFNTCYIITSTSAPEIKWMYHRLGWIFLGNSRYDKVSDVVESRVRFASKILTPHRMH